MWGQNNSREKDDVRIMLKMYRKLPQNYLSETEKCQKHELGKKNSSVQCMYNMIAFKICLAASVKVNVKLLLSMSLFFKMFYLNCEIHFIDFF